MRLFSRDAKAERIVLVLSQQDAESVLEAIKEYPRTHDDDEMDGADISRVRLMQSSHSTQLITMLDVYNRIMSIAQRSGWIEEVRDAA